MTNFLLRNFNGNTDQNPDDIQGAVWNEINRYK